MNNDLFLFILTLLMILFLLNVILV